MTDIEALVNSMDYTKAQIEKLNDEYQEMESELKCTVIDLIHRIYMFANKKSDIYKFILYYEKFNMNDFSGMNFPQDVRVLNYNNTDVESLDIIKSNGKKYLIMSLSVTDAEIAYVFILPLDYVELSTGYDNEVARLDNKIRNAVNLMEAALEDKKAKEQKEIEDDLDRFYSNIKDPDARKYKEYNLYLRLKEKFGG